MRPVAAQNAQSKNPDKILSDCREVNSAVDRIEGDIRELDNLTKSMRGLTTPGQLTTHTKSVHDINDRVEHTLKVMAERMKRVKEMPESGSPRNANQVGSTDRRLRATMHSFQVAGAKFRDEASQIKKDEYRIAFPDATEDQLQEAANDLSDQSPYQQAVSVMCPRFGPC